MVSKIEVLDHVEGIIHNIKRKHEKIENKGKDKTVWIQENIYLIGKKRKKNSKKRIKGQIAHIFFSWKRPNLQLIGTPQREGERISSLENTFEDIIHKDLPNLTGEVNMKIQKIEPQPDTIHGDHPQST